MKITNIKQIGKSTNYKIFVDEEYAFDLCDEIIVLEKVKIGAFFEDEELKQIVAKSKHKTCFGDALKIVSKCLKTTKQVKDKLKEKGYLPESIESACQKLLDYGYLNDLYFAKVYAESKKNSKGVMFIKNSLMQKGVSKEIAQEVLCDFETDIRDVVLIAQKFVRNKKSENIQEKLLRHLVSKGFDFAIAKKASKIVLEEKERGNDWD